MKQDWELIRKILIAVEDQPPNESPSIETIAGATWSPDVVIAHTELLKDAGYLKAMIIRTLGGGAGDGAIIRGLTMDGYNLLKDLRNDTVWGKIKSIAKEKGLDVTLDVIKVVAPTAIRAIVG